MLIICSALAKCFVTPEIMRWPHMEALYGPHLRETDVFKSEKRWEDLHTRIIEHVSLALHTRHAVTDTELHRTSASSLNTTPVSDWPISPRCST